MIPSILMMLTVLLSEPSAASAPVSAPAVAPAAVAIDPVIAQIDGLMTPWRGRPGDPLRGRLGLSSRTRPASDGEVVFWVARLSPGAVCRADPASGAFQCGRGPEALCQLAVAFDKDRIVKTWKAQGAPAACQQFVGQLGPP